MAVAPPTDTLKDALVCDHCGQYDEVEGVYGIGPLDLSELIRLFGWRSTRGTERWMHYCPHCVEERKHQ